MTISELDSDIDFLCGSTSANYSPTNKRRNMNIAYLDVARIIWESDGGWNYDDKNATTLPQATTDLVNNQQDYTLPSTAQMVHRVEVLDATGNWLKLRPLEAADVPVAMSEVLGGGTGTPIYYELAGSSILLYPTPTSAYATLASGLKIYISRDVTEFAVSATTAEPGFPAPFHRILSYASAIDFTQDESQRNFLILQKERLEEGLRRFYAERAPEVKTRIKPSGRKWRNYL